MTAWRQRLTDDEVRPAERDVFPGETQLELFWTRLHAVEHDVGEHVGHEEGEAAGETLRARERAGDRPTHHRVPQVLVLHPTANTGRRGETRVA